MPLRPYPHPIPDDAHTPALDHALRHLVGFRSVAAHALEHDQPDLVGDFAAQAMAMAYIGWLHGLPPGNVANRASDAVAIALAATTHGYVFKSPYDYWLLCCWAVGLDHPLAEDLLALPAAQWSRTATTFVPGLLPEVAEALAQVVAGGDTRRVLAALQSFHRDSLGDRERREEALRFAPTIGALVAVATGQPKVWAAACKAREDGWQREAWLYPTATMFLVDAEWLAMMRLAQRAGFELPADSVYRPHALLGASAGDPGTLGERLGPA